MRSLHRLAAVRGRPHQSVIREALAEGSTSVVGVRAVSALWRVQNRSRRAVTRKIETSTGTLVRRRSWVQFPPWAPSRGAALSELDSRGFHSPPDNAIFAHFCGGHTLEDRWSTYPHWCSMTQIRLAFDETTWDGPIRPRMARGHERITPTSGRVPTVEEAIAAWLVTRGFAPSTGAAARQHLESGRARGWRSRRGIATIDQLSAEGCLRLRRLPAGSWRGPGHPAQGQDPLRPAEPSRLPGGARQHPQPTTPQDAARASDRCRLRRQRLRPWVCRSTAALHRVGAASHPPPRAIPLEPTRRPR